MALGLFYRYIAVPLVPQFQRSRSQTRHYVYIHCPKMHGLTSSLLDGNETLKMLIGQMIRDLIKRFKVLR